jgi:hypothetical protein
MPAAKFYRHKDVMIPVDEAKIVDGYVCPFTKKSFVTKKSYLKHLLDYRKTKIHRHAKFCTTRRTLTKIQNSASSLEELVTAVNTNSMKFQDLMHSSMRRWDAFDKNNQNPKWDFELEITHLSVRFQSSISNNYNHPKNGVTNYSGRELFPDGTPKPTGYPGFRGRIECRSTWYHGSDILRSMGILTGTGGGIRNHVYGYDCTIFLDDWPGLKDEIAELIFAADDVKKINYVFEYGTKQYFK